MLSRRTMVTRLAALTAAVFGTGMARVGLASTKTDAAALPANEGGDANQVGVIDAEAPKAQPAPWNLIQPLAAGSVVAHGWSVAELSGIEDGSCVLTLKNERGRQQRIHVCRNDGQPQGIAHSGQFDLLLMNGGQGDLPTDESLALALAEVAQVLQRNEARSDNTILSALMPHNERLRRFDEPVGRRLR